MLTSADPVDGTVTDRAGAPRDGLPPLAPRGLRLQSRRPAAGGADATGPDGRRGLGRGPRAAGRHAAGIGRAGHGRRVRPRRPVAGDRGGRRAEGAADRDPLAPGLGPGDPDLRGGAGPGRGPRLQRRRPQARGGRGHDRTARAGSPPGTRRRGPCSGPWTAWAWSCPWRSTRTGPGSPSRITARRRSTSGTSRRAR